MNKKGEGVCQELKRQLPAAHKYGGTGFAWVVNPFLAYDTEYLKRDAKIFSF